MRVYSRSERMALVRAEVVRRTSFGEYTSGTKALQPRCRCWIPTFRAASRGSQQSDG